MEFGAQEVQYTVRVTEGDNSQHELYCCLYKNQEGRYSAFSPYLKLERYQGVVLLQFSPLHTLYGLAEKKKKHGHRLFILANRK